MNGIILDILMVTAYMNKAVYITEKNSYGQ